MRASGAAVVVMILITGLSCRSRNQPPKIVHAIGERVQVGQLSYEILEADWKDHLGDLAAPRISRNKFLLIQLKVTNTGGTEAAIPLLSLEDPQGQSYMESTEGAGVPEWLGLWRNLAPRASEQGRVIFDVPSARYILRVSDGEEPEMEKTAMIEIPVRLGVEIPQGNVELPAPR
jgi:hypothetical protein